MKRALLLLTFCLLTSATMAAEEAAGPVLRMELEKDAAVPGQPIVLRITLLAPTWLPKPPVFPSFEVPNVIVRLPQRASGPASARVGKETWSGVTRAYRLYPMTVGRFRIPPQPVTVTYADPKVREPLTAELLTDEVVFKGTAPAGAEDLDPFIAAETLSLEQTIDGEPGNLEPGQAFTRTVTVRVKGSSPIFLPHLIPPLTAQGIASYPKEPVVTETEDRGIVSGERVESVTYVAEAGGRFTAPPIRLRWFNLRGKQIETAEATGFEIQSRGPSPAAPRAFGWRGIGPWAFMGIVLIALAGFVGGRFRRRITVWNQGRHEAYFASEAFAFSQAKQACRKAELGKILHAVELWSSRLPPAGGADDIRLSDALACLGAAVYGDSKPSPSKRQWFEAVEALQAARRARLMVSDASRTDSSLPTLNPRLCNRAG